MRKPAQREQAVASSFVNEGDFTEDAPRLRQRDHLRRAELLISGVLRGGVALSIGILVLGVVLFFVGGGTDTQPPAQTLADVAQGVLAGSPLATIMLGLLVLLVTPVLRVLVSIAAFALEHDWRYVAITTLVLVILAISFVLGKGGA